MPQRGYVCDDTGWPLTVQASTSKLHDTGFGPIAEFGDECQSDARTWAMLGVLLVPWVVVLGMMVYYYFWAHK